MVQNGQFCSISLVIIVKLVWSSRKAYFPGFWFCFFSLIATGTNRAYLPIGSETFPLRLCIYLVNPSKITLAVEKFEGIILICVRFETVQMDASILRGLLACLLALHLSLRREAQNVEKQNRRSQNDRFFPTPKLLAAFALLLALVYLQAGDKLSHLNLKSSR
ncbi:hypothetical protein T4B_6478 [Trichinella pseudospiralis]|uniref:Uncharacterized protein n=1 Tax=Trichinella pseudospiralis TaxID=6337 RepID=A0A0V1ILJ3_TRIPS|nr:hypothetical protein T4E_1110 [Trichinella pseudospiralis]KRX88607.1 hypothetical protein T4E_12126 [Trichinella pseudospiralis]KRZ23738.1 hypothetical protein T4B_6478 [Trichinella pseudospiralis]